MRKMFGITVIIAVVLALTELVKKLGLVSKKYLPAVSLFLGLLAGVFYVDTPTIQAKILYGVMIGLAAGGLFDQSKIIMKK
jgi:hypothetical protein